MIYLIYILVFLSALAELLLFDGNKVGSVAVLLLCAAFVAAKFFLRKKMSKKLQNQFLIIGIVLVVIFILNIGFRGSRGGLLDYTDRLSKITEYLAEGEYEKASEYLEDLEEEYGSSDGSHILSAIHNLEIGDILAAKDDYNRISNRKQELYFALGEQILKQDYSENATERLYNLYIEAANEYPAWAYMQFWAGVSRFEQKNYKSAEYYLLNAYNLDENNPSTLYYLGAVKYAQNEVDEALKYFDAAVAAGANETLCSYIAWYLKEIGY